jgi:hypothetical protein
VIPSGLVGTWVGSNGFRLMPDDPLQEFAATVSVTTAAGHHLALVTYTWEHPDDGPQDGVLLVGPTGEGEALVATWGDSWHQKPAPMTLTGERTATGFALEAGYGGGWAWRIRLSLAHEGALRFEMDNVVPPEHGGTELPQGAYPVMVLRANRS